jgi:hypothetical protein
MPILGCDYSFSRPNPSTLAGLGIRFAGRYYSTPGNGKNLTAIEASALTAHGIDPLSVYETTGREALGGYEAGVAAARSAAASARQCGQPLNSCIYYAVDFDASSAQLVVIGEYFKGVNAAKTFYKVGVYGGYYVVQHVMALKLAAFGWQTSAWSQGKILPGVHVYQNNHTFSPDVDVDYAYKTQYGGWNTSGAVTPEKVKADAAMSFSNGVGAGIGTDGRIYLSSDGWSSDFGVVLSVPTIAYLPGVGLAAYPNNLPGSTAEKFVAVTRFPDESVHVVEITADFAHTKATGVDWPLKGGIYVATGSIGFLADGTLLVSGKGTDGHIWTNNRSLSGVWGGWTKRNGTLL